MQIKKILIASVASCLSMSLVVASAQSNMVTPTNLWQRSGCTVDGVQTNDVSLIGGEPKTADCVWGNGDAGMQVSLHAGQLTTINASCKFTPAKNSNDQLGRVIGDKAAKSINNLVLGTNPVTFSVTNDNSDKDVNVRFVLNPGNGYQAKVARFFNIDDTTKIDYTTGDAMICTFTALMPV